MDYILTSSFSVILNGKAEGHAFLSRGLRQDDSLIFARANDEEAQALQNILCNYEVALG
ncbi:hypothetical protein PanWU01x14_318770 [Parasponia andersonii]|uniref:Uncharacterized protein n=1 Tax=Parasponia andersonii TaxID=3476 RepID=A0A2P5AM87_PARAD|nr:hypothetical protein PanWU01x14_318770 [Parasponia andersonii]